jgi:hypothetical protein
MDAPLDARCTDLDSEDAHHVEGGGSAAGGFFSDDPSTDGGGSGQGPGEGDGDGGQGGAGSGSSTSGSGGGQGKLLKGGLSVRFSVMWLFVCALPERERESARARSVSVCE